MVALPLFPSVPPLSILLSLHLHPSSSCSPPLSAPLLSPSLPSSPSLFISAPSLFSLSLHPPLCLLSLHPSSPPSFQPPAPPPSLTRYSWLKCKCPCGQDHQNSASPSQDPCAGGCSCSVFHVFYFCRHAGILTPTAINIC